MKKVLEHLQAAMAALDDYEAKTDTQAWALIRANRALAEANGALEAIAADEDEDAKEAAPAVTYGHLIQHWRLELSVSVPADTPEQVLESTAASLELAEAAIVKFAKGKISLVRLPAGSTTKVG